MGGVLDDFFANKPQYVFSTSIEKDCAHQWLNYGNTAPLCIEFDREKLCKFFTDYLQSKAADDFYSSQVEYDIDKIKTKIKELISIYAKNFSEEDNCPEQFKSLKEKFYRTYACSKQNKFWAEKEYRFSIYSERRPEFRTRGNLLVSYIEVGIEKEELPITGIIIGPYNKDGHYKDTVEKFLKKFNYNIEVASSELSLRQ